MDLKNLGVGGVGVDDDATYEEFALNVRQRYAAAVLYYGLVDEWGDDDYDYDYDYDDEGGRGGIAKATGWMKDPDL